ncbi:Rrf2 family transcriptional regulator [uncultured Tateyamaria sp.]|uniref:RrF2 family transcriptional regulator n=1 Tax=uncultured Tateyamaria sp. TaxID=455651 RepID=UPI00260DF494|nr:Rrf2 family transcriptional regulator [uncultured Tateyamaria sp.]
MRQDNRLSRVLHALLHLDGMDRPATSEQIAQMLQTNSAVVRRTMSGLREAGIVTSTKGHGGGWALAKPLTDVTLFAIYEALGSPKLFAIGNDDDNPSCLLARAAYAATDNALHAAQLQFRASLDAITVKQLAEGRDKDA